MPLETSSTPPPAAAAAPPPPARPARELAGGSALRPVDIALGLSAIRGGRHWLSEDGAGRTPANR